MQAETLLNRPRPQQTAEYHQRRDDTTTFCAEVLDGNMQTEFSFTFDGSEFYGHDGRALTPIFDKAIVDAEKLARVSPKLAAAEKPRRFIERGELDDMFAMARGELPNTMIVESDFPYALKNETSNLGGYNVLRQQTMQRVITFANNTLTIRSQSLDRSDRRGLEAIYHYLGVEPKEGELLGQRVHKNLNSDEQAALSDKLRDIYDDELTAQHGGEWFAGRTPAERANTYDFVVAQSDLLDTFLQASSQVDLNSTQKNRLRYQLIAAIDARWRGDPIKVVNNPLMEMFLAGQEAEASKKTFSGCGLTIDAESADSLAELGYGNKTEEMHCPFCNKKQIGDPCSPNQKCKNKACEAEVRGGKVIYEGHKSKPKTRQYGRFALEVLGPEHNN